MSFGNGRPSVKICRKIVRDSYSTIVMPGVSTIFHGDVTATFSGMIDGRQRLLGSSFPKFATRSLYTASAHGWNGTSFTSAAMLMRYLRPGTCQMPDRSGWPLAFRGVGAAMFALPFGRRGMPAVG